MHLNKTDVIDLDAFTETCKDCIIERQEKEIERLRGLLRESESCIYTANEYIQYTTGSKSICCNELLAKINAALPPTTPQEG